MRLFKSFVFSMMLCSLLFVAGAFSVFADATDAIVVDVYTAEEFHDAWDAANSKNTVTEIILWDDITTTTYTDLTASGADITIDLNGYCLHYGSTKQSEIRGDVSLTFYSYEPGGIITSRALENGIFSVSGDACEFTLTYGKENFEDNLTVSPGATFLVFTENFQNGACANINFLAGNYICESQDLIQLNSNANAIPASLKLSASDANFTFSSECSMLSYHDELPVEGENHTGIFDADSLVTFENCKFSAGDGNPVYFFDHSSKTFAGSFFGKASFTNCVFDGVMLNGEAIYSHEENRATHNACDEYVIPTGWDASKQITVGADCVFSGVEATFCEEGNAFAAANITIAEGCVLAHTGTEGNFAVVSDAQAVAVRWLGLHEYTDYWVRGAIPSYYLCSVTLGDNTYTVSPTETPTAVTENVSYTVQLTGGAQLSANIVLYASIDFNVYVPVCSEILAVNGVSVKELSRILHDGNLYYKIPYDTISPKHAYKTQKVILTVSVDDSSTATVERYVSILGYAKALLAESSDENEKILMCHALAYIKAVSHHFETATEASDQAIDEILGADYAVPEWTPDEGRVVTVPAGLTLIRAAGLDLSNMPGFVVYVDTSVSSVRVDGITVDCFEMAEDELMVKYAVLDLPVGSFLEDFTVCAVSAEGTESLLYNIETYFSRITAAEGAMPIYAEAFYAYAFSARNYLAALDKKEIENQ